MWFRLHPPGRPEPERANPEDHHDRRAEESGRQV
jgi:hypothetical protein